MGFDPKDVRWVVMTHMHGDHAGGIGHFPNNEILLSRPEANAALARTGPLTGYLNMHYPSWLKPTEIEFTDGPWESFYRSETLTKDGKVHIVSTPGHTEGHMSVVIELEDYCVLIAGDASYSEVDMLQAMSMGSPSTRMCIRTRQNECVSCASAGQLLLNLRMTGRVLTDCQIRMSLGYHDETFGRLWSTKNGPCRGDTLAAAMGRKPPSLLSRFIGLQRRIGGPLSLPVGCANRRQRTIEDYRRTGGDGVRNTYLLASPKPSHESIVMIDFSWPFVCPSPTISDKISRIKWGR